MAGANPGIDPVHCSDLAAWKLCCLAAGFICFVALIQGAAFAVCTHPHRGVFCACHRKDAHSVPAQGLNALTTRPVWSRLSRSHPDAAWSALKRSRYRAVFVRLTLALVVQSSSSVSIIFSMSAAIGFFQFLIWPVSRSISSIT